MFQFKVHGNLSFQEMDQLTAEDRSWWMDRLKRHHDEQNQAAKNSGSSGMPNFPKRG